MTLYRVLFFSCSLIFASGCTKSASLNNSGMLQNNSGSPHKNLVQPVQLFEVEKRTNGTILRMEQPQAIEFCAKKGQHLPSARELAVWAVTNGATPILELSYVKNKLNGKPPRGYELYTVENSDGSVDSFYYWYYKYNPLADPNNQVEIWSSSDLLNNYAYDAYLFKPDGQLNLVGRYSKGTYGGVRCAPGANIIHPINPDPANPPITQPPFKEPQFTEVIRKADGSVKHMVWSSEYLKSKGKPLPNGELGAVEYCKSVGMRLPTIRELAYLSIKMGAKGIVEFDETRAEPSRPYYLTEGLSEGIVDKFYFNSEGYKPQGAKEDERFLLWSSSIFPDQWLNSPCFLDYVDGRVSCWHIAEFGEGVRCVSN